jgi:clathrin heavy chain
MFQLAALEREVRERAKKDNAKEEQEADQPIINPGLNRLLITQGNGFAFKLASVELQI